MAAGSFYENITDSYVARSRPGSCSPTSGAPTARGHGALRSDHRAGCAGGDPAPARLPDDRVVLRVLLLRSSGDVAREEIRALEEALRIAQKKFNAGSATKFDVLTTQVRLSNAHNRLTDILASLEKQENGLRQLLGIDIGAPLDVAGTFRRRRARDRRVGGDLRRVS